MDSLMDEWLSLRKEGWTDGWTNEWMDGDGWMYRWMD